MKRIYAVSTRLEPSDELKKYLNDYFMFYNSVQRRVFYDFLHDIPGEMEISRYISYICSSYNILKRTANSIRYNMQGRIKAFQKLKKTELAQLDVKINTVQKKVDKLASNVGRMKFLAAMNLLDKADLSKFRALKASLYHQKNKLNKLRQKRDVLTRQIKDRKVSLCFGTKKLLDARNRLCENGFRSHTGWLHTFRKRRDSGIFFLGSGDESYGNQILQLKPDGHIFSMKLRLDRPYEADGKYLTADICFPYMARELAHALSNNCPVSYRITRKGRKWYLTAIFSMETDVCTNKLSGIIGIDYNNGFMEAAETDRSGNLIHAQHISLKFHGTGKKAESEMKEKLSRLVRYAASVRKDIAVEDLDFRKKKASQRKGENKRYNKMLHLFDYHRYLFWLENLCAKYGVNLVKVNPAYTSKIGKEKYSKARKLTVHRAAAFVIARKGQGFVDLLTA